MEDEDFRTPGQMVEALLVERGWTQRVLAIILGVGETGVNKLIAGKQPLTADMALLLCEVFDLPAESAEKFLDLEKRYELARARMVARPDPGRAMRARLFGGLPITEMSKRGWLDVDDIKDVPQVERSLAKFFKVDSVNEIAIPAHAAKKTDASTRVTSTQLAWIYRVKEIADEMLTARYSSSSVRNAVSLLSKLLSAPEEARKVPRILAECGIRYVIVESLPSAKIDGVCLWLNDTSPVIGMTLRYDRIDNFWFVLRHELQHVLCGHGRVDAMLDAELEGERAGTGPNISEEERVANGVAAEFCVPQKTIESFIARKSPFFNNRDILGLANTLQIHPGLIAGQLQHRTGRYDRFRQHLAKIRYAVTPSAAVDGWGDIFPVGL
ncbi:MAG: ImmA/IrrE family metallo-endopeptidase [Syntrophobacteraceae bacterium]